MDTTAKSFDEFAFGKSKKHLIITTSLHCLALFASLLNDLPELYRYALSCMVLASSYFTFNIGKKPECRIRYSEKRGWSICHADSDYCTLNIAFSTVISKYLTIMHFYIGNQYKSQLVFPDSLTEERYRLFSVLLKTSGYQHKP